MVFHIKIMISSKIWKFFSFMKRVYRYIRPCLVGFLIAILISFSFYYTLIKNDTVFYMPEINEARRLQELNLRNALAIDQGLGCVMPKLDPFSSEIMQFNKEVSRIVCAGDDWVECYLSKCKVKKEILNKLSNVKCYYKDVVFVSDEYSYTSTAKMVNGDEIYNLTVSDHAKVSCSGDESNGLKLFSKRWFGHKAGFRTVVRTQSKSAKALNVMLLFFDSVSRNGFIRKMPKSYEVLLKELDAVVLKGYNIVGDATVSAMMPILTGHTILELPDWRKSLNNTRKIDIKPFIFSLLKNEGYRTAYFEDRPRIGTFQYSLNGFEEQPTDHYLRPFFLEQSKNDISWWMGLRQRHCVGDTPRHVFMMNLTHQFHKLDGYKFSVTFNTGLSHDDLNLLSAADEDLVDFLMKYKNDGLMEDTLLFVIADHGPRFDFIRNTYQGRLEERLPMVSIVLPNKFKYQRPKAIHHLRANAEVLTTPFDVHTTLLDAMGLMEHRNTYKLPGSHSYRGMSFLEPIPVTRSCAEAGVLVHWCACINWINLTAIHPMYSKAAQALADFINNLTADKRTICAKRHLLSVEWVLRLTAYGDIMAAKTNKQAMNSRKRKSKRQYFQAKIIMNPNKAIYEGSMVYDVVKKSFNISITDISRINPYGDEPLCISKREPHLNKFCYCLNKTNITQNSK